MNLNLSLGISEITPVIYTGNAGDPSFEYRASDNPNVPQTYIIDPQIPPGARVIEAWYTPFHNIAALSAFAWIDVNVNPQNPKQLILSIAGYPGSNNRLRIKIHTLWFGGSPADTLNISPVEQSTDSPVEKQAEFFSLESSK